MECLEFPGRNEGASLLNQIKADNTKVSLSKRLMAICNYAHKPTTKADKQSSQDLCLLREYSLSDKDILDITLIVAYFNFVNRIALGLGVSFSEEELSGYKDEPSEN